MTLSPVIERELRVALRKKDPRKSRLKYSALGVALASLCLLISYWGSFPAILHEWLFYIGLYIAVIQTLQLTSDLFTQERQNQTLGLLFLAGLDMPELFGGKVASAFLVSFTNLIALAPSLAMPFLTGGISFSLFVATLCCLPVVLVFTLAISCLASALCEDDSTARIVAVVIAAVLSLIPPLAYEVSCWCSHAISPQWRLVSPAWGPWIVDHQLSLGTLSDFWWNSLITLMWSGVFFILAGVAVRQVWKRDLGDARRPVWGDRLRAWAYGSRAWRRKQALWLDRNPFVWLATRNRQPERLAWGVVILVFGIVALCCWVLPRPWLKVSIFLLARLSQLAGENDYFQGVNLRNPLKTGLRVFESLFGADPPPSHRLGGAIKS